MDALGNLYATSGGGDYNRGYVFELSPPASSGGDWTPTTLYNFCPNTGCPDGEAPSAGVTFDAAGNLYGTTYEGGTGNAGVVYQLSPDGLGAWTETVLHSFASSGGHGFGPVSALTLDGAGNIYGTTFAGGMRNHRYCNDWTHSCGGVFRLLKNAGWAEQFFKFDGQNGGVPLDGVYLDAATKSVYGTTELGGAKGKGTLYRLQETGETVLYSFCSLAHCADGSEPASGGSLIPAGGKLYGTASSGGIYGYGPGVVFEITP
jgi:uncharacterized repeat protein (TIGR03803 family)